MNYELFLIFISRQFPISKSQSPKAKSQFLKANRQLPFKKAKIKP
jgi:hypothetical protein